MMKFTQSETRSILGSRRRRKLYAQLGRPPRESELIEDWKQEQDDKKLTALIENPSPVSSL